MRERTRTVIALLLLAAVMLSAAVLERLDGTDDIFPTEDSRIMLYGESHGFREYYGIELEKWQECYENGCRDLFMELPFYTAEYLNIWMKMDSDIILDGVFRDLQGTLSGNEYFREMLMDIKKTCPKTVFHGTDVGHQYDTTGQRYLAFLEDNGLEGTENYLLAEECIRQGMEFYAEGAPEGISSVREKYMTENFISAYERLGGARVMGIYGSYHTDTASPEVMFASLRERYGDAVSSVRLSTLAMEPDPPYRIGLCLSGIAFLLMLMIPNLLWAKGRQPRGYEEISSGEIRVLLALERTGEVCVSACLLIFPAMEPRVRILPEGLFFDSGMILWITAFFLMILYEFYWIRYFRSGRTLSDFYSSFAGFPVAGASLPVIACLILGIYSGNLIMTASSVILGIGHIGIHLEHRKEAEESTR